MCSQSKIDRIIALLCWSALFVYGCGGNSSSVVDDSPKPTMISHNLTITNYQNGKMTYRFDTPHLVRYEGKDTVYMIFDEGIHIVTFDDSTSEIKSWLRAKYAIYRESIDAWEVRDSVVAEDKGGKTLYTDLLFWERKSAKIHSPQKTTVVNGEERVIGLDGFESDENLENIEFYNSQGRILVDTTANTPNGGDTLVKNK